MNHDSFLHDGLRADVNDGGALPHDDGALSHYDSLAVLAPHTRRDESGETREERTNPNHQHQSFHDDTPGQV